MTKNIHDEVDIDSLNNFINGLKHSKISFDPEYGSSLILKKDESFKPTEVYLVFPKAWDFQSYLKNADTIYLPSNPVSSNSLEIGTIVHGCSSLEDEKDLFLRMVEQEKETQITLKK